MASRSNRDAIIYRQSRVQLLEKGQTLGFVEDPGLDPNPGGGYQYALQVSEGWRGFILMAYHRDWRLEYTVLRLAGQRQTPKFWNLDGSPG